MQRETGKRTLSEFRADQSTSTYNIHVLVSSDGQRLVLRAKLLDDPVYLRVPVLEDGKVSRISRLSGTFAMLFSMLAYKFICASFLCCRGCTHC